MLLKFQLSFAGFLQFFIWGSWLISFGTYLSHTLHFSGAEIGAIYATMGIASLFMPTLMGIIADKWVSAEKLLSFLHIMGAIILFWASSVTDADGLYWFMLLYAMMYMPSISLFNTICYNALRKKNMDIVERFPLIRVWGTVGFIIAMWAIDILDFSNSAMQLRIAGVTGLVFGIYAYFLPSCPPAPSYQKNWIKALGLDAFSLLKNRNLQVFFLFSMLLGAALQITNAFGESFLYDFKSLYPDSFTVKHPGILLSISQISEALFILSIPFILKKYGIKTVMILSMMAWTLRFGFFAIGNPNDGFIFLILSMIIYGLAFDFFNIAGSIFVNNVSEPQMKASAQGLFMLVTNGVGAILGGIVSGIIVDAFTYNGIRNWQSIWSVFAVYALILCISFSFLFKYKHQRE